jgi:rhodanese-related sulfurtransferase
VQAVMTAHWLRQMGWREVYVLKDGLNTTLATGRNRAKALGLEALSAPAIAVQELHAKVEAKSVEVIDVDSSLKYRKSRIPGSWYALRSRLGDCLGRFAQGAHLVFTSSNGVLARYAAQDARAMGFETAYLEGGTASWKHAGLRMEQASGDDDPRFLTATEDVWYRPYERNGGVEQAMQQYLTWEVNLLAQLEREPYVSFSTTPK